MLDDRGVGPFDLNGRRRTIEAWTGAGPADVARRWRERRGQDPHGGAFDGRGGRTRMGWRTHGGGAGDGAARRAARRGFADDRADALSGVFGLLHERIRALGRRMDRLEACTERLEVRMNILIGLLVTGPIVLVAAPYLGIAFEPGGGGAGVPLRIHRRRPPSRRDLT